MSVIGLQPIMLKDATFAVESDDYSSSIMEATFVPQVEWMWSDRLSSSVPVFGRVRWVCQLGFVQDLTTPGALSLYLISNAATTKTITFTPVADGPTVTAEALIVPAQVGGVPNQQMTAQVILPLFGEPAVA